ncbi:MULTISPECIES: glycosyl transferase [unclassified Thiocapsa]
MFDAAHEPIDHVVRLEELGIADLERWTFDHDVIELCTAVKGPMLCRLLETGANKVVYLDPDIALFGDLHDVEELLDLHDVLLTPHHLEPDGERQTILDNEIGSLKHGIYNLGFLAVANTDEGCRFARWWRDRLFEFCFDDIPNGIFTDQRWCDLAPVFFPGVHVLRDPGYNVASWNLSRRPISIGEDGNLYAADQPLRFVHFANINGAGETMLERYAGGRLAVFEFIHWYRSRLAAYASSGLPSGWWAYGTYSNGSPILREHRLAYRTQPDLRERFPSPFTVGPNSLAAYFAATEP